MSRFISDAQLNSRDYFAQSGSDLFTKIMERIGSATGPEDEVSEIREKMDEVRRTDVQADRLGLVRDEWDYDRLANALEQSGKHGAPSDKASLAVISQYVDTLHQRSSTRKLIVERLTTFERVMSEFYEGKSVAVVGRRGLQIESQNGQSLAEDQLSAGEYHLLYLMVSAVLTRRVGTIIAIDEPELSLHIEWQRKLVSALLECSAHASPQLILATHSPQIAASYPESLVVLEPGN